MKRLAILTSGGDAPGMNACIRATVRLALDAGFEVFGVMRGYKGLVEDEFVKLDSKSVGGIVHLGGTMLLTSRCPEFCELAGQKKALANLKKHKIDCLIVIGGNGTMRGAKDLINLGFNCVCIPGTIDNDLYYTDYTIGFDTAVNTVSSLVNNMRDTMMSHERPCVIEVMGADCGDIALNVASAVGAEIVLVPENKPTEQQILNAVENCKKLGKASSIIITNEHTYSAEYVTDIINKKFNLSCRPLVVGHIQRGGSPSAFDRNLALRFASKAIELANNKTSGAVGIVGGKIISCPIEDAFKKPRKFDKILYSLTNIVSGSVLK